MSSNRLTTETVCLPKEATIRQAMEKINQNCLGVVFILDGGLLLGAVTDGDFRRLVLTGAIDLEASVEGLMNESPATLSVGAGAEETFRALSDGLERGKKVFPRVDLDGSVKGFSYREDWGLLPVAEPSLTGNEASYILQCIENNWVSSSGPFVAQFERAFAEFTGLKNPVAASNGTVALTLAMQALKMPPGSNVIVPSSTFAATANAVIAAGGIPVFSDVDPETWGLSPELVEPLISPETWGIIPVHLYGNPCDVGGLRRLADTHGLAIIEDCAEAIGTSVGGRHVGATAQAATFSFFGNKTITTGEGGMVFFQDQGTQELARQLRSHGMSPSRRYWHDQVGNNFRMTNVQAAIGVAQVERAGYLVERKREIGSLYRDGVEDIPGVSMMPASPFGQGSFWLVTLVLDEDVANKRDVLMELMAADGIQTRIAFPALHNMPAFENFPRSTEFKVSQSIEERGLSLPNTPMMSDGDVEYILSCLKSHLTSLESDSSKYGAKVGR